MCSTVVIDNETGIESIYAIGGQEASDVDTSTKTFLNEGLKMDINTQQWQNISTLFGAFDYAFCCINAHSTFYEPLNKYIYMTQIDGDANNDFGDVFVIDTETNEVTSSPVTMSYPMLGGYFPIHFHSPNFALFLD